MTNWKGPVGRTFVRVWSAGALIAVFVCIVVYAMTEIGNGILYGVMFGGSLWVVLILGTYLSMRPMWSSVYTHSKHRKDVVIERIGKALKVAEVGFTRTDTLWSTRTVLELPPMEVVVDKELVGSRVYVGPGDPTDVEHLKGLVERALG